MGIGETMGPKKERGAFKNKCGLQDILVAPETTPIAAASGVVGVCITVLTIEIYHAWHVHHA